MDKTQIQVLLIEDNPVDVVLLREALGQDALNSFDLTSVERLQSAVETLSENSFDIILLDLGLPDAQGLETFTRIQQLFPETPKIILSGLTDETLALQAVHVGAQDYIVKGTAGFTAAARAIRYAIERNKGQQQLRVSEERFRYLFDNNPHPMWAYDIKTLEFLAVNDSAVDKYGYTREEFLGMTIADIRPAEDVQRLQKSVAQPRSGPLKHAGEWRHKLKDGTIIDVDISSHTINLSGRESALVVAQDITERRRAEAAVRASEERFRAMIENGLDDISLLDVHGNLLWESPAIVRNLGYPENAFVGQNIFNIVHPEDKAWTNALYARLIEVPGSRQEGKFRLQRADGTWRWVEAIVTNMLDNPSVQAIVVNYRDITERKQAEEALRASEERYRGIFDGVQDAIFVESLEGDILDVNQRACEIFGYSHAEFITRHVSDIVPSEEYLLRLWDDENISLEHSYETINVRASGEQFPVEIRGGFYEFGDRKLFLVVLRDITERKQAEKTIRSLAKFPEENPNPVLRIGQAGQILYANTAGNTWLAAWGASLNDPLPDEWRALVADAYQRDTKQALDIAIQDHVYAVLIVPFPGEGYTNVYGQDVTESKRAEDKLRYQANLLANINDAVVAVDDQYRITSWNHAAEVIYGWRADEVLGRNGTEIIRTNYSAEQLQTQTEILIATGELHVESVNYRKDNELIWVDTRSSMLRGVDGTFEGLVSVNRDITERKQANEKLQSARKFLQGVQNALSAHIAILNADGDVVQVNAAWREFADQNGLAHTNYGIGLNYLDICDSATGADAEDAPLVAHAIREILAGKVEQAQIEYACHSPAEKRWFLLQITSFKDGDKKFVVLAHENITERKLAENTVRETSEQFRTLFEASPEAIMIVDPNNDWTILDCNATGCAMNGYTHDELIGQSVDILNPTPGNPAGRMEYLARVRTAGVLRYEASHRRKDGTFFPIEVSTSLIMLSGREVILGIDRDITERKQAEKALRESEALYRQAIEVAGAVPYRESYADNGNSIKYEFIGEGIRQITGYGPDEFNAQVWDSLAEDARLVDDLQGYSIDEGIQRVRSGENPIWKCEYRIRDKAGNIHWVFEAAVELRDENGVSHGSIGTYQDITVRKQAEEKLRASEYRYHALFEDMPVAVWEDDLSKLKLHVDALKQQGVTDWHEYFAAHPEAALQCRRMIKILDVNKAAVEMYQAKSKEELIQSALGELGKGELENWAADMTAIANGETGRSWEGEDLTMNDTPIEISLNWSVVPGHEHDFSRVIFTTIDITERKQAEEKLRESEARFASIFHTNPTRVSITSLEDGRFLDVNESFLASTGLSRDEVIGRTSLEFDDWVNPQERTRLRTLLEERGRVQNFETKLRRKSGEVLDVLISAELVDLFGQSCILSVGLDISDRKQAEEKLSENAADLALINRLNESINHRESLTTLINVLEQEFKKQFNTKGAALYLLSEDGQTLTMPGISLPQELAVKIEELIGRAIPPIRIPVKPDGLFHKLMNSPQGTITTDPREIQQWIAEFAESDALPTVLKPIIKRLVPQIFKLLNIKSVISLPLTLAGKTIGVLDVSSAGMLDAHHLERFQKIGGQLSAGILRHQDEQKLLEANERFQQLADNIEEVFWITDAINGEEIYISPAAEKIWGRSIENLMQTPRAFIEHILPEDQATVLHSLDEQKNGQSTEIEYRIVQPDESVRWIWDRAFPIFDDFGKVIRLAGIAADVTARKQSESVALRHLSELEALYENGLAIGRLLDTNEIAQRIIATFAQYLSWHHVAIRLKVPESDELKLIALNQDGLGEMEKNAMEFHLNSTVSKVGQGLSGWVVQTEEPLRTGNVHAHAHYVNTYPNIRSGLYMPLKAGGQAIGVISVESETPDAFTEQDERLLATLANQAAIAFENARLYQSVQQELQERKRAEAALRMSETHYRELADSITDIFFELDQGLCFSHWNKASELLTGIPARDAIGKAMRDVFGESEEQTRIERIYKSVLAKHLPRTFETPFTINDQIRAFEVNAYPSTRGVAVVAKDVTERNRSATIMQKRFELMEFAARHSLEEIMEMTIAEVGNLTGSAFGFFHIMGADQTTPSLQIWSTNALSLFNVPVSEGRHRSVEQAGVWADAVRQRRALIHNDYESLPNKKGIPTGHAPIFRDLVIPVIRNEKILAVMGIANKSFEYTQQDLEVAERFMDYAWDITERKQMEQALADERNQLAMRVDERTADLSRANANLARALRVKDEFLANMSHELRTPLNAILGLSESLAEQTAGPLNDKQQRYITTVSESGHHLLSLINDILDLAKIEAGQIELDVNKVDIQSVCDASMRMIKQLARKKNQNTEVAINGTLGLMWADERRLKQMLVNLLSNAVKFTPEGGKLGLEVHGDQDENKVTFTVWDTGIGIKASDLPRLFQPFVQLDAGLARESSGTGLGLALVAQMARMHGGSASVVSEPGKGSRFSIMLPWEPALAVDTVERLKITGKFKAVKFNRDQKPTILLIEDTEEVIMMLSDYLELNGFKTIIARDGLEGITQAQLTHPDLILMDIQMPRMDGFETTKKLRSEPEFKTTPIIALTALAMPNDRERCLEAGMDEYITKPVHLRALVKIIELFLSGETEVKSP